MHQSLIYASATCLFQTDVQAPQHVAEEEQILVVRGSAAERLAKFAADIVSTGTMISPVSKRIICLQPIGARQC